MKKSLFQLFVFFVCALVGQEKLSALCILKGAECICSHKLLCFSFEFLFLQMNAAERMHIARSGHLFGENNQIFSTF